MKEFKNECHHHAQNIKQSKKLIRIRSVTELTGLSKSYIYQLVTKGLFPSSIRLIAGGSAVAWVEEEVNEWIDSRIQERDDNALR